MTRSFSHTVLKTITDLESIGDNAKKIGRLAVSLASAGIPASSCRPIEEMAQRVREMLHGALDAFADLDAGAAVRVMRQKEGVKAAYDAISRRCRSQSRACGSPP